MRRERSDFQHLGERLSPASCTEQSRATPSPPPPLSPTDTTMLTSHDPKIVTLTAFLDLVRSELKAKIKSGDEISGQQLERGSLEEQRAN